jgi:hypothetical protein
MCIDFAFYKKMEETQKQPVFTIRSFPQRSYYYWSARRKGDSKDAWSMRLYADDKMTDTAKNRLLDKEKKSIISVASGIFHRIEI